MPYSLLRRLIPAAAVLLGAFSTEPAQGSPAARPNLVLILADDMGYSDLGCYGSGIETPNLDRLASEGLRFSNFHNTGRCCPSRAALLTGLYPHRAGIGHMLMPTGFPGYSDRLRADAVTVAEVLGSAGYHTVMAGKWHLGWADEGAPNARGFDRFYGARGYVDSYFTVVPRTDIYLDGKIVNAARQPPVNRLHPEREFYTTDTYTDYALHFMAEHFERDEGRPIFAYLAYNAPHFPLHAKPEDTKKYRGKFRERGWTARREARFEKLREVGLLGSAAKLSERESPAWEELSDAERDELDLKFALYCAIIDRLDQNVGRVVDFLREAGELDNTVILFLSDNGAPNVRGMFGIGGHGANPSNYDEWGRKGGWTSSLGQGWANVANAPFRRYKREAHEGGTASPLIIWAGEKVEGRPGPGGITHESAHIIDLLPTLAEWGDASVPAEREGRPVRKPAGVSLVPVVRGEALPARPFFWEHEGNRATHEGNWKLVARSGAPWELYNLSVDRCETRDLAEEHPERVAELESKWNDWAARSEVLPWQTVVERMKQIRERRSGGQ